MLLKALRNGLGYIIICIDFLTRPKALKRSDEQQKQAQASMQGLSLYQFNACPFCIKTRRALHELNVAVDICDINKNKEYRQQLEVGGGRVKVPCLRIETESEGENQSKVEWLYESNDIIAYLKQRVDQAVA